jgi:hypothetical protein
MGKLDTVAVNGPEGEVLDWDAVEWRRVEDDGRRRRLVTEGLLEPVAGTMPSTGLCRVDVAECMFGLVNGLGGVGRSA